MPEGDDDFPTRWRLVKSYFTKKWGGKDIPTNSPTRQKKGEHAVWQRRYWEHLIRDELDLKRHVEYIHYNPVKHGYSSSPVDWPYSSFRWYVKHGLYVADWAAADDLILPESVGME